MDRRTMLKVATAGGLLARTMLRRAQGAPTSPELRDGSVSDWKKRVLAYLNNLARPDGGFGWEDQLDSHLTPTFAAIACYRLLGQKPPNMAGVAQFVRTHHPITGEGAEAGKHAADLRTFVFQQIQSLLWLGEAAKSFQAEVEAWTQPTQYPLVYEQHGYPVFQQETMAFVCWELLGLPLADISPELIKYVESRRRPNGSFNNTPALDGSDGHVMNTLWGIWALRALGRGGERRDETVAWLRACQLPVGGFTYQPKADVGGIDDVAYTWAAVRALKNFDAAPTDRQACANYLRSLWNADGGFGDRPGLPSRPEATYYALDALAVLGESLGTRRRPAPVVRKLPDGLKPFTIQIEAQGNGSPVEAVELARAYHEVEVAGRYDVRTIGPDGQPMDEAGTATNRVAVQFDECPPPDGVDGIDRRPHHLGPFDHIHAQLG